MIQDLSLEISLAIADAFGGNLVKGDMYYKKIDGEFVGKKSVQCVRDNGTTFTAWYDGCDKSTIDTRYWNLDGTRK